MILTIMITIDVDDHNNDIDDDHYHHPVINVNDYSAGPQRSNVRAKYQG